MNSTRKIDNTVFLQGRIYEGKEPPQFVALFQPMVVLKVIVWCLQDDKEVVFWWQEKKTVSNLVYMDFLGWFELWVQKKCGRDRFNR